MHLQPFFAAHEHQIDATLSRVKVKLYAFVQDRARLLWEAVASTVTQSAVQPVGGRGEGAGGAGGAPPRLGDPVSGPATLLGGLWSSYGPGIVAGGAALLRQTTPAALSAAALFAHPPSAAQPALITPPATVRQSSTQSVLERKKQLEAELAALEGVPMPAYAASSRSSSNVDLRSRAPGGQFEEIEAPSDVEGYDLGSGSESGSGNGSGGNVRPEGGRTGSGWFGWGAPAAEKAKSD